MKMNSENGLYNYKNFESEEIGFKDVDGKKGIVTGYFANFGNVDSDGDIIRSGAFTKTVRENGPQSKKPRIKHLLNHDPSQPLGKLIELKEDEKGLYYESQLGSHSLGQDFIKMVESGLVTEHSIGFRIIKRNQLQDYDGYRSNPSGGWFEITEVKLWEGSSLTAWGANEMTPIVGMKGVSKEEQLGRLIRKSEAIEKFCRDSSATDETIEMLLLHNKQITQLVIDLTTEPDNTTLPEAKDLVEPRVQFVLPGKN